MWMLSLPVFAVAAANDRLPIDPLAGDLDLHQLAALALQAAQTSDWAALASLGVVLTVWAARRYLGGRVPFLTTKLGGVALVVGASFLGAVLTALAAGAPLSAGLALAALKVAVLGVGIRKLSLAVQEGLMRPAAAPAAVAAEAGAAAATRAESSPQAAADELGRIGGGR